MELLQGILTSLFYHLVAQGIIRQDFDDTIADFFDMQWINLQ